MKEAAKNILTLIAAVFALVVMCAPLAFAVFCIYALFHFIFKFW